MLKIRLTRVGKKNAPTYRIVVCETRSKRDGNYVDLLGHYNPYLKQMVIDQEKLQDWQTKGAQISEGLQKLLDTPKK